MALKVSCISGRALLIRVLITIAATFGMTVYLQHIQDSAPFWDALTTVLSIVAQYMLNKKFVENWYAWMIADLIYIPLGRSFCLPLAHLVAGSRASRVTLALPGLTRPHGSTGDRSESSTGRSSGNAPHRKRRSALAALQQAALSLLWALVECPTPLLVLVAAPEAPGASQLVPAADAGRS
jgi:hypothetical protein